ncbi:MAG: hypothetical protein F6J93_04815 [Oscillatoria sp. SIO1A7]|nr:hypothetical protein [Oscillatoria sp. SIO1A7]
MPHPKMFSPNSLDSIPDGTKKAIATIASFDRCLLAGFANLDDRHLETLASLQRIFSGTPLEKLLTESCAAIERNEFLENYFTALAAARASLQGSLFDSLQQQAREILGRTIAPAEIAPSNPSEITKDIPDNIKVWLDSTRNWLMEIALVGWARLEPQTLTPFLATLEQMQAEPTTVRLAALLTGFFNELMSRVPVADSSSIPSYRWGDLWSRAAIAALQPSIPDKNLENTKVSGRLELLGLDLRHHANFISAIAYGVLETNSQSRWVRITLSSYKVDSIFGQEIWRLFRHATSLFDAWAQNQALSITDMPLLPTGDLLWNGNGQLAEKYNLMKKAAEYFAPNSENAPAPNLVLASDRHPIQLAEPIFLKDYQIERDGETLALSWGDSGKLPVATELISPLSELTIEAIASSTELFGLLRFDAGRWAIQPLAVAALLGKKKSAQTIFTGATAAKVINKTPAKNTIGTLQERASRLLRR